MSKTIDDILIDKIVEVKPIIVGGDYYPENHDGAGIFSGATWSTTLAVDKVRKQFYRILDKEEQALFEKELNKKPGELDFYDRFNPFWTSLNVKITKEGLKLNLREPLDNLKWRILNIDPRVAKTWNARFDDGRFRFVLLESGYEVAEINKKQDKQRRAFKAFGKIEDSIKKMTDVLTIYGKNVPKSAKLDWLQAEIGKLIDDKTQIDQFLAVVEDPNYETRLLITNAIEVGALVRSGRTGYRLPGMEEGKEYVADNISEMIDWIKDPMNQPGVLKIKAQINAA